MTQLELAEDIARLALKSLTRRDGKTPAIMHTERVVAGVHTFDAKVIAWLHDVLEDTDTTTEDLLEEGIHFGYVSTLNRMTHNKNVLYNQYIRDMLGDDLAVTVKVADIVDNITDKPSQGQIRKYREALTILALE